MVVDTIDCFETKLGFAALAPDIVVVQGFCFHQYSTLRRNMRIDSIRLEMVANQQPAADTLAMVYRDGRVKSAADLTRPTPKIFEIMS